MNPLLKYLLFPLLLLLTALPIQAEEDKWIDARIPPAIATPVV